MQLLKASGDKALQAQALNELGDVQAHFAQWPAAVQAWNDALDLVIGPYQARLCTPAARASGGTQANSCRQCTMQSSGGEAAAASWQHEPR